MENITFANISYKSYIGTPFLLGNCSSDFVWCIVSSLEFLQNMPDTISLKLNN